MSGGVWRTTTVRVTYVGPPATTKVAVEQERRAEHAAIVAVLRCASMLERHRLWFRKELSLRLSEMWIRDNFTFIEGCERGTTRVMNADEKLSRRNPSTHPHLTRAPKLVTSLKLTTPFELNYTSSNQLRMPSTEFKKLNNKITIFFSPPAPEPDDLNENFLAFWF